MLPEIPDRRHPAGSSDLRRRCFDVGEVAAGDEHQLLAAQRRQHVRARRRQPARQLPRMIADEKGRIMVVMTHNTDIGDSWEREGEDYDFFIRFAARLRPRRQRRVATRCTLMPCDGLKAVPYEVLRGRRARSSDRAEPARPS